MTQVADGVVSSVVVSVDESASVRLHGGRERTVFLAVGDSVEITLHESHVVALRDDIATALGDIDVIDAADRLVERAYDAGAQARRAAELALERAEVADRAGDAAWATRLRNVADAAVTSAVKAQTAAEVAEQAMADAEAAAEHVHVVSRASESSAARP